MPIMKKEITLKELNANGQLILSFKQHLFVRDNIPNCFNTNRASTCYVHYYKHAYIVTQYILQTRQYEFIDFQDAQQKFNDFINII